MRLSTSGLLCELLAATLLDSCMGLAVHSTLDKRFGQTTLEFKISLVRPVTPDTGLGRILAHGTTTCLIFEY
jgi:acyl-coenzyme A thioesterase PaaI-like protein